MLVATAEYLLKHETLDGKDFDILMETGKLPEDNTPAINAPAHEPTVAPSIEEANEEDTNA